MHEDAWLLQQDLSSLSGREAHPLDDGHFVEVHLKIDFEIKCIFEIFPILWFLGTIHFMSDSLVTYGRTGGNLIKEIQP